jgi:hypothetical protein
MLCHTFYSERGVYIYPYPFEKGLGNTAVSAHIFFGQMTEYSKYMNQYRIDSVFRNAWQIVIVQQLLKEIHIVETFEKALIEREFPRIGGKMYPIKTNITRYPRPVMKQIRG